VNYWGYNTLCFFAPRRRYSSVQDFAFAEFKEMVARLHDAGIEVILDVVYNHTAEGNERGPTLSFKGIDLDKALQQANSYPPSSRMDLSQIFTTRKGTA